MPDSVGAAEAVPATFHVIAHRGASAYAPENTLAAVGRALELGAVEVELDLQLSRDDVLVVFHDDRLDEKTDLRGRVGDYTAAQLRRADIGRWFDRAHPELETRFAGTTLATLEEVFETFGDRLYYHLEMKGRQKSIPRLLLEQVVRFGLERRVMVTSFSRRQLDRLRALDREIPLCLLVGSLSRLVEGASDGQGAAPDGVVLQRRAIDAARAAGFEMVAVRADELTRGLVEHAHARGLEIRAWRVRTVEDMEHTLGVGANGMTLDWPERLLGRLRRNPEAERPDS